MVLARERERDVYVYRAIIGMMENQVDKRKKHHGNLDDMMARLW